jgi:methylenetetrahydrofolate--tRNA-(uracil-5-)-methyltransferase
LENKLKKTGSIIIIGGGLAGSEAAWQAAENGIQVELYEMRPFQSTGAHTGGYLAELICSNSLGSKLPLKASSLLLNELEQLGSLLVRCALETSVPAGGALAVDRDAFARMVTGKIEGHPKIRIVREEMPDIPDQPVIIASGPLTSQNLVRAIQTFSGEDNLFFYDAVSPIVNVESIDMGIAFRDSRYLHGVLDEGDYINCPLNPAQYELFITELLSAETIELKEFEEAIHTGIRAGPQQFFEGCLPIEILAARDRKALAFGPMQPVGLRNKKSTDRLYAVVQLRQDNLAGTLYNMVGFQTNLKIREQERVFRLIPGLELAQFDRYGQMHRNTFIFSPTLLRTTLQSQKRQDLFFAGQITGVEGYLGNIATGLLAGINAARFLKGANLIEFPATTMIGALCYYITHASKKDFQPMKANYGLLPPLEDMDPKEKDKRRQRFADRSFAAIQEIVSDF